MKRKRYGADATFGKRIDVNGDGREILRMGTEEVEIFLKYCVSHHCLQCVLEGKIPCHPRFRT